PTISSARPKSPRSRTTPAVSSAASSRKTRARAASAARSGLVKDRPDFDGAAWRPGLGHAKGVVKVCHLDFGVAADHLVALQERPVRDERRALGVPSDGCRVVGPSELAPAGDLGRVFREPRSDTRVLAGPVFVGHALNT